MLTIFYRRFYILLFLVWLVATAGLFVLSVWGDFDTFVSDFSAVMAVEETRDPAVEAGRDVLQKTSEAIVHKAQVARDSVRREIRREVETVEEVAEEAVRETAGAPKKPTPKPAMRQVEQRAVKLLKSARKKEGAGKVGAIAFSESPDRLVTHLTTSRPVEKVTVFWLDNPTRLVVDLRGKWVNKATRINRFKDSFMYRVILGMHPDRLRVVFKFADPKSPKGDRPGLIHSENGLDIVVENPAR